MITRLLLFALLLVFGVQSGLATPSRLQHFIYFGRDRDRLPDHPSLQLKRFVGAQIIYSWKELEPRQDTYQFEAIEADLRLLKAHGLKLWIQLQDATFRPNNQAVPAYIMQEPEFNGGANPQYDDTGKVEGWVARRWDPAVRARFQKLLQELGQRYDGVIAGINLQETAIGISENDPIRAPGFTAEGYRDGIRQNMTALKRAFPRSVVMQYANFMPGEALPENNRDFLASIYDHGEALDIALGTPDLLPRRPYQQAHAYRFMRKKKAAGKLKIGVAVQDGNYRGKTGDTPDPVPGETWPNLVPTLVDYAEQTLGVTYMFWSIQEPYFTKDVIPFLAPPR